MHEVTRSSALGIKRSFLCTRTAKELYGSITHECFCSASGAYCSLLSIFNTRATPLTAVLVRFSAQTMGTHLPDGHEEVL